MKSLLSQFFSLGVGAAAATKDQLEQALHDLVRRGELTRSEASVMLKEFTEKGVEAKKEADAMIKARITQIMGEMNLASKTELEELRQRVERLERNQ